MKVATVQMDVVLGNPQKNLLKAEKTRCNYSS